MKLMWIATVLALSTAACTRQAGTDTTPSKAGSTEVGVTLDDFSITPATTAFAPGVPYRFIVTNTGEVNHEFMITPAMGHGMSMDDVHDAALVEIHADDLPPGATRMVEYTFSEAAAGKSLEMACHTDGHYEAGMRTAITVGSESSPADPEGTGQH